MNSKKILITGAAGFIGFHLSKLCLDQGNEVIGIDSINDYYDVRLKHARLAHLDGKAGYKFERVSLEDGDALNTLFAQHHFDAVVNLAAQPGVRYSIKNPHAYVNSNLVGFVNILEACRHHDIGHLVFASSSSVYGANRKMPFSVEHNVDHPLSLYAATKKANELMAHTYANLFKLPVTGLRFFTVYGPWGRPDMAMFSFTKAILAGEPIDVYNHGHMKRDFTYVDDIVQGVYRVIGKPAKPDPSWNSTAPDPHTSFAPYALYNIGNNQPVELLDFIHAIEDAVGRKAKIRFLDMQPGDVIDTYADISDLERDIGFKPDTPIKVGVERFVKWYREFYGV